MVRRKSVKKIKHKNSRSPRQVSKFRMNSPKKVNLTSLPPDIMYSISRYLTPIDRARLASTSKSIRANKNLIYEAPMENIEIVDSKDLKTYLNYFRYLVGENINFPKISININQSVGEILERWFINVIETLGEKKFKKISINIGYLYIDNYYLNSFDYKKYNNIKIHTIYMLDMDTAKNIPLLKALDDMNVERVIYKNNTYEDIDICKYLCKVKTVSIENIQNTIDFSSFGKRGSKTENICIRNSTLETHEYFSGMNCVYIDTNQPAVNINNIHTINYLVTRSLKEVNITNSYNIKNLIICTLDIGLPIFEFNPLNVVTNIHIVKPRNSYENRVVSYLEKNGFNVINEINPCKHPILDIFM
jgi:hypothetical protein